jgi:hypothetical protein
MSELLAEGESESIRIGDRLDEVLAIPDLKRLVNKYFENKPNDPFAGKLFDTLENHGCKTDQNKISVSDLLALNLLDVSAGPIAIKILLSDDFDNCLVDVNSDCDIWNPSEDALQKASEFWTKLDKIKGLGRTKISKLCARKRPRLIPITDSIVERVLNFKVKDCPLDFWQDLGKALNEERIEKIRDLIPKFNDYEPTILRTLDVAIWMIGSNSKSAQNARGEFGLGKEPIF